MSDYESHKRNYTPAGETGTTEEQCAHQGFAFIPMVLEAHSGGWGRTARQVLDIIVKQLSASWCDDAETASLRIAQRLSATLHKENARAILRRLCPPEQAEVADDAKVAVLGGGAQY